MWTPSIVSALENAETPLYFYDMVLLKKTLAEIIQTSKVYDFHVHYALKANNNTKVLQIIQEAGLGADCVSGNEIELAVEHGFKTNQIVFAGVGKTVKEILTALKHQIFCFNVESVQELEVIAQLCLENETTARIALRINPNVDAHTHHYITTGLDENKFGILTHELPLCLEIIEKNSQLQLCGLHFHIGSQITDLNVFKSLCVKVNEWNRWFINRGHEVKVLNVGGGLGIDYDQPDAVGIPDFAVFFAIFNQFLERKPDQQIHFELGRSIVGQCGSLISRVLYIKNGLKKNFAILDAGMTELLRPSLYQAYHKIETVKRHLQSESEMIYDVVGPICESSDCFGKEVRLAELNRGDLIAIRSAGAYGEVMALRYNLRAPLNFVYLE
ncbi:diaminopimelate decarboxylase [Flavobacterium sp. NKUCC04_CG]|uniref:diaminopimelate decarboxylase n=1 Tax=Flavobacterium sp. NKUCC04_CG TaxID=2842121 RepID=UPI001C5BE26A|nr:diaminopimelate decarboxylase [Flavobacterium sp. NKUCC04_CG]MBW3520381.1 diaminopimelate decarboxylase [Flavobacterium sp. NKUCC04_CG]